MMTAEPIQALARDALAQRPIKHINVPRLQQWLDSPAVALMPYTKSYDKARLEPFVLVHTSGSTGEYDQG